MDLPSRTVKNRYMIMKSVYAVFFFLFILAVNLQNAESKQMSLKEIKENMEPLKQICIKKVKVDPKLVDAANKGDFADDYKLKCYYKCLMMNAKLMKNDKIVEQAMLQIVEYMIVPELVDPILDAAMHCAPIAEKSLEGCELAFQLVKCTYDFNPEIFFYP